MLPGAAGPGATPPTTRGSSLGWAGPVAALRTSMELPRVPTGGGARCDSPNTHRGRSTQGGPALV